ncbi:MAG: DUF368 domain-containing protein [Eubacteriales bacterium]
MNHNIAKKKQPTTVWLLRVIQGAIVGGGAILPGISGGVLCVTFGIYRPMMALLAHPIRSFRLYYKLFIPFLVGWTAGFLMLARVIELLFETSSALAVSLFIGLIAGTLPSLLKDAGEDKTDGSTTGFAVSLFIVFTVLSVLKTGVSINTEPNAWWYFFCGAVWGLSLVVPGMSSSSILLFMGLYQPMTAGIAALHLGVILPLLAGIAVTAALLARLVNYLFESHHSVASYTILGIIIASTLLIVPTEFNGVNDVILSFVLFAVGFAGAAGMDKYGEHLNNNNKI